jgi:hypothetical protein
MLVSGDDWRGYMRAGSSMRAKDVRDSLAIVEFFVQPL